MTDAPAQRDNKARLLPYVAVAVAPLLFAALLVAGPLNGTGPAAANGIFIGGEWTFAAPSLGTACTATIIQGDTALDIDGTCNTAGTVDLTGTINTTTGVLSASGTSSQVCSGVSISATAAGDGNSMSGTLSCTGVADGAFTGTRVTPFTPGPTPSVPAVTPTPSSMPLRTAVPTATGRGGQTATVTPAITLSPTPSITIIVQTASPTPPQGRPTRTPVATPSGRATTPPNGLAMAERPAQNQMFTVGSGGFYPQ